MPWRISYQHPLRPDDGGIRFVPDQSEAVAEKLHLELRGYAVSKPTQTAALRLIAQNYQSRAAPTAREGGVIHKDKNRVRRARLDQKFATNLADF